ncbi:hypothetical protein [cf. Phormidesmis sp. LEGE 11477]|uniref:hypothetical protein n=1 Tax=cf. Phormidesmis sp. LEGE 11477 TaxID=1828680 RepID=UPI0018805BD6|nr:hypothetical protein [cf. Phormidesmis sp. LEGE 11477]MBE9060321.1 hypothetical protein [cf. Phormidesmis sp. LEGE 11477]
MLLFNRSYKYRTLLVVCFYAGVILFVSASAGIAQDAPGGATSILENAIDVSKSSEEGLNELWEMTFTGTYSPGYLAVMDFAKKVMVIPFFWMLIPITQAFTFNRYEEIFKHVAWIVLICVLTVNSYGLMTKIAYGSRNFVNDTTREILSFQLGPVSMKDALSDVLLTEEAKETIRLNFVECEAKEGEEQLKCFEDGAKKAKDAITAAENKTNALGLNISGLKRLTERLDKIIGDINLAKDSQNDMTFGLVNFFFQSAGQAIAQQLMKGFQSAMMTIIDVGFYLTAMLAPIAVAASLAPLQPRIIFIWGAGFIAFALMKMSYNILIGAIATVALTIDATNFGSTGLLIAMGVISPLLAMAMGGWGGARLVHAMAGGASAAIALVPVPMPRPK